MEEMGKENGLAAVPDCPGAGEFLARACLCFSSHYQKKKKGGDDHRPQHKTYNGGVLQEDRRHRHCREPQSHLGTASEMEGEPLGVEGARADTLFFFIICQSNTAPKRP